MFFGHFWLTFKLPLFVGFLLFFCFDFVTCFLSSVAAAASADVSCKLQFSNDVFWRQREITVFNQCEWVAQALIKAETPNLFLNITFFP